MDRRVVVASAVVVSLGLLSAILGFAAEGTKLKPSDIQVVTRGGRRGCLYPRSPAAALGLFAVVFLLVAQITASALGGCCGCCKSAGALSSGAKRAVGVVCSIVSWVAAVIACGLLLVGAAWNVNVVRSEDQCYCLGGGAFAGAAALSLFATALGAASYALLRGQPPAAAGGRPAPPAGIAMGQMQFPPAGMAMGQPQFPPPQAYAQPQFPPPQANAQPQPQGGKQFHPPQV